MAQCGIRESTYEPGVFFIPPEPGTTQQSVGTQQWKVGPRYSLEKVLGYGSFSAVCLAVDNVTGEKVALKRIGDVLHSPEQAKRVLREICILRRLSHPNVISVRDVFVRPAATGQCRLVKGVLVHISIDVYIAMEYADSGDLFHMLGQLSEEEVKSLMWQMSQTLRWLHSLHVWHRDLKTQNVFLVWENGQRVAKIGDFGSARSAIPQGYGWAEQAPPGPSNRKGWPSSASGSMDHMHLHSVDSYQQMQAEVQPEDLYVQYNTNSSGSKTGFKAPLTRVVATPCYRAPEVVMSRGGYTSSIDMWSLGCIFGELLSRIAHVGSAATPNLQVAPLFAILQAMPKTPEDGQSFLGNLGDETTRRELQALFDVIGTPAWADVSKVQDRSWRHYLHRLPGKAPTLYRRFCATGGEAAVDLLTRLLTFDPARRASAEEALAHEFFADLKTEETVRLENSMATTPTTDLAAAAAPLSPQSVPAAGQSQQAGQEAAPTPNSLAGPFAAVSVMPTAAAASPVAPGPNGDVAMADVPVGGAPEAPAEAAAAAAAVGGPQQAVLHYYDDPNPGRALAMLEVELSSLNISDRADPLDPSSQRLRQLLEMEVAAMSQGAASVSPGAGAKQRANVPQPSDHGILRGLLQQKGPGLQEDTALSGGRSVDYGRERLTNVADTWQGRELDPARILGRERHGEWTASGPPRTAPGPSWGGGNDESSIDPKVLAVIKRQQLR